MQDLNLAARQRHLLKQCEHLEIEGRGEAIAPLVKDHCQQRMFFKCGGTDLETSDFTEIAKLMQTVKGKGKNLIWPLRVRAGNMYLAVSAYDTGHCSGSLFDTVAAF